MDYIMDDNPYIASTWTTPVFEGNVYFPSGSGLTLETKIFDIAIPGRKV